ncbi:MAG: 1-(5-phosphoribosyl)-5-[(5-phosphoribosylamino)methylideneamino]imidazole-4-carboxamide isomerase [Christensenellales bacterium]
MIIYPAIDLKDGVCVRLKMGDLSRSTQYGDPAGIARKWREQGARYLHVVDLDAAFTGKFSNKEAVLRILETAKIPVQLGGGVRSLNDIKERLSLGLERVIVGTAAVENPRLIERAAEKYPGRIVVGIDAKNGRAATRGWTTQTDEDPVSLALNMKRLGIKTVIYTDITRDGMLFGPNTSAVRLMAEKTGMEIIASGGVSGIVDVYDIKKTGARGVIIGKALYTGDIDLKEALQAGRK